MREEGREAYEAAMEKQRRGGAATDVYAHGTFGVSVKDSEGTRVFGLEDIQDMQRDLAEVEAVSEAMPAVPDQQRVLCDGCKLASSKVSGWGALYTATTSYMYYFLLVCFLVFPAPVYRRSEYTQQ